MNSPLVLDASKGLEGQPLGRRYCVAHPLLIPYADTYIDDGALKSLKE
jgi:hypothetical protein